jgi:hypothetical protein
MIAVCSLKTTDGGKSRQQKAGCPAQAGDRLKGNLEFGQYRATETMSVLLP